jgi:hypothetical protein
MNNSGHQRRLRIFTWHIHGSYLYYLSQGDYEIYIPINEKRNEGYYGRGKTFPFGDNVIEVHEDEVRYMEFDCILFQTNKNFLEDQYDILSEEQWKLPRLYVEHDPPWGSPSDAVHIMDDEDVVMVHVTHFNRLMWHNNCPYIRVIEHGVMPSPNLYKGDIERGITVINNMHQRGRKLGADIFDAVAGKVPLDLTGMGTAGYGSIGEVLHPQLPEFISRYRFFFNPIRYTSLGLAVCEAMMQGMPIVALATTEYATVIQNGVSGFIHTDVDYLVEKMQLLIHDRQLAKTMGENAKTVAEQRFSIARFTNDWKETFTWAININAHKYEKQDSFY